MIKKNQIVNDYLDFTVKQLNQVIVCYDKISRTILDAEQKRLIEFITHIKRKTLEKLRTVHNHYNIENSSSYNYCSLTDYLADINVKPMSTIDETFLFLFKKERAFLDLYTKLAKLEEDTDTKRFFYFIVEEIRDHIRLLGTEFKSMKQSPFSRVRNSLTPYLSLE